jgi:hypothetical protein
MRGAMAGPFAGWQGIRRKIAVPDSAFRVIHSAPVHILAYKHEQSNDPMGRRSIMQDEVP